MKNLLIFAMLMFMTFLSNAQDRSVNPNDQDNEYPRFVQDYVNNNFSNTRIDRVDKNRELTGEEYHDVYLDDGTELRFDHRDSLTRIQGEDITPNVLPRGVYEYTQKKYKDRKITSWEKMENEQYVLLDDNTRITFDSNGMYKEESRNWNQHKNKKNQSKWDKKDKSHKNTKDDPSKNPR